MSRPHSVHRCVRVVQAAAAALIVACAAAACHAPANSTHDVSDRRAADPITSSDNRAEDEHQLRELYTQLLTALATHDAAQEDRLTCAKDQGRAQRRVDSYPMSKIDFFGAPADIARAGVPSATDRLAPISKFVAPRTPGFSPGGERVDFALVVPVVVCGPVCRVIR